MGSSFKIDPKLIADIKNRKCAIFVGAGMSRRSGLPSWGELLNLLIDRAVQDNFIDDPSDKLDQIRNHASQPADALMVAQELSNLSGDNFREYLVSILRENNIPSPAHLLLPDLPMKLAITTNYDRILEKTYAAKRGGDIPPTYYYTQAADFGSALWDGEFFILKAHGDIFTRPTMVITDRDYRTLIHNSPGYKAAMSAIFTMNTVLFLGVSLTDPDVNLLLSFLYDAFHGSGPRHYAFVPDNQFSKIQRDHWLKEYRIRCITYTPTAPDHPEVEEFLNELIASI